MRTIWKYDLAPRDEQVLEIPKDAEILCVKTQRGNIRLWAMVDPEKPVEPVTIVCRGTGHDIDDSLKFQYIDTVLVHQCLGGGKILPDAFVFHFFKLL